MRMLMCTDTTGTGVAMPLSGWEVATFTSGRLTDHLDGIDVLCPIGAPVDEAVLRAGRFGLVQQFGVGLDNVDVATATELGPLVNHPSVIATPHIAGVTRTVLGRSLKLFAKNLQRWAAGQPPNWAVNAPAHPRRPDVGS